VYNIGSHFNLLALTIVYFIIVVSDMNIYIYTYIVTQRDGFRKIDRNHFISILSSVSIILSIPCMYTLHCIQLNSVNKENAST